MKRVSVWRLAPHGIILLCAITLAACGSSGNKKQTSSSSTSSSSLSSSSTSTTSSSEESSSLSSSSVAAAALVLAINSGSFTPAIYQGVEYLSDQFATGGTANSTSDVIAGDPDGSLFQTERYGSYRYEVPVTDATYSIQLHFVEMYNTAVDKRSFNVLIEGEQVISAIDLFAEVGHDAAYSYTANNIDVSDGYLTIELETLIDNSTLSGFAIYSNDGEFIPPPEPGPGKPGEPGVASAENNGADCPVPAMPTIGQLPAVALLPDPFTQADGVRITERAQWRCLRQETNLNLQNYEAGIKPPKPETVAGAVTAESVTVNVAHDGEQISFTANITLPTHGEAPYPAMIGIGASNLDNAYLASKGIAVIAFNNNQIGAQAGGSSRGTGLFFDLYGSDHSASSMTAWAWGVSRLIDVLTESDAAIIDASRLGVTGCSRNGKGALMAGALDERIALTIPQESGAGGAVAWRVAQSLSDNGKNIQTLSHAAGEQPWFRESFGQTFGGNNVARLPFDHHQLMGMVAPRGLLVLDNDIDWLGPLAGYIATLGAKEIYTALGVPENIAYSEQGGHNHCAFPGSQLAILSAFVQRFLLGEAGNTDVMRSTQGDAGDLDEWINWTTATLQ